MPIQATTKRAPVSCAATLQDVVTPNATIQAYRPPALEKIPTQAAPRMGLSVSQVYREIKAGRLGPLVKLGARSSAVPAESVDAWIAARIAEATNKSGGEKIGGAA